MSDVSSVEEIWDVDVTVGLTTHTRHRHIPSPVSQGFVAPDATSTLTFSPIALAAAVARTATTRQARPQLLAALQRSAQAQMECLVSNQSTFELSADFGDLADTERTLFTARCGAGITDLYMNALGYVWRANAACLARTLDPHADFLYDGGSVSGHGVVLAEAHGTFASNASAKTVAARAKSKYGRQVKPFVSKPSPYGKVVHGYSVAFGSQPGTAGAFLSVAETRIARPKKAPSPPPTTGQAPASAGVSTAMAMTTYRSNFLLMGAVAVIDWIDWIGGIGSFPTDPGPVTFIRVPYAGRWYLGSVFSSWPALHPDWWADHHWHDAVWRSRAVRRLFARGLPSEAFNWFVIEETACQTFLNSLTGIIRAGGDLPVGFLELPSFEPVGFGFGGDRSGRLSEGAEYNYALFRDGLALIGDPFWLRKFETRQWSPKEGFLG
ncbi:hypothetical protein [Rhizobium sp. NZLR1]|uniref:hypothetical protein n=1 Tax=Rhizobium sp. NZLR1 TaxID=2731096 RepID=UPI001A9870F3|nr:hypothetical protein [Rhizobium sp. NZLR1]MBX5205985.1 hypothetical protein [Rhizobium sp. NZLR1]QSZ25226.1 hypothetical protein J3O30_32025 [Rhizobium sp. NZLR1]